MARMTNEDVIEEEIGDWTSDETFGEGMIEWSKRDSDTFVRTKIPFEKGEYEVNVEVCKMINKSNYKMILESKIFLVGKKAQDRVIYMEEMRNILSILK